MRLLPLTFVALAFGAASCRCATLRWGGCPGGRAEVLRFIDEHAGGCVNAWDCGRVAPPWGDGCRSWMRVDAMQELADLTHRVSLQCGAPASDGPDTCPSYEISACVEGKCAGEHVVPDAEECRKATWDLLGETGGSDSTLEGKVDGGPIAYEDVTWARPDPKVTACQTNADCILGDPDVFGACEFVNRDVVRRFPPGLLHAYRRACVGRRLENAWDPVGVARFWNPPDEAGEWCMDARWHLACLDGKCELGILPLPKGPRWKLRQGPDGGMVLSP